MGKRSRQLVIITVGAEIAHKEPKVVYRSSQSMGR